jgi:hypothetical protein
MSVDELYERAAFRVSDDVSTVLDISQFDSKYGSETGDRLLSIAVDEIDSWDRSRDGLTNDDTAFFDDDEGL